MISVISVFTGHGICWGFPLLCSQNNKTWFVVCAIVGDLLGDPLPLGVVNFSWLFDITDLCPASICSTVILVCYSTSWPQETDNIIIYVLIAISRIPLHSPILYYIKCTLIMLKVWQVVYVNPITYNSDINLCTICMLPSLE